MVQETRFCEYDYRDAERQEKQPIKGRKLAKGEPRGVIGGHWRQKGETDCVMIDATYTPAEKNGQANELKLSQFDFVG